MNASEFLTKIECCELGMTFMLVHPIFGQRASMKQEAEFEMFNCIFISPCL